MNREIEIIRASAGSRDLPDGMRERALTRARALLYALGTLSALAIVLNALGPRMWDWHEGCASAGMWIHATSLLLTIAFLQILRRNDLSLQRLYDLAFGYEVLVAFGIAFSEQSQPAQGISIVAIVIVMFPLFIPSTPRRTFLASMAAAATVPLAYFVHRYATGAVDPIRGEVFIGQGFVFLFAGFAVIPARLICAMTDEVKAARQLGSYELVEKLGSGGMGEVWSARHRLLRRPAAIKLIRPDALGSSEAGVAARLLERFEREAQATASLESPHTVALFDFGRAADGTFFHVIELLRGLDLETLVRRFGPLPAERVVSILLQICDSLDDAHRVGLIHRDIKPANIFLTRRGRRVDFVKVLDFGLVKFQGKSGVAAVAGATQENAVPGTPAYMAPEMTMGTREIDGRIDLYALGCVAYWFLTGELVFDERTPVAMAVAHSTKAPVPPSQRTELDIPPSLERIVLQCLAKSPDDRPSSALELVEKLRTCGVEPWSDEEAQRWWSMHLPELVHTEPLPLSIAPISATTELGAAEAAE